MPDLSQIKQEQIFFFQCTNQIFYPKSEKVKLVSSLWQGSIKLNIQYK